MNERDADRIVRERIGGRVNCTLRHQSERRGEEKRKDGEGREGEGGARREEKRRRALGSNTNSR